MQVTDKIFITNEDNQTFMSRYHDGYFDLAIIDPPYGIGEDGEKNHSRSKATKAKMYTSKNWDRHPHSKEFFIELKRISKNQIIFGANHFIENIPQSNSSCWIVWDKDNTGDFADCELAYTSFKTAVRKFQFRWNGMIQGDMKNKEIRIHPTQKPVALYKWILDKFAKPGYKICDTNLGSGSIAIACHDYDFELHACEIDSEIFENSFQRIKNHTNQQKLF